MNPTVVFTFIGVLVAAIASLIGVIGSALITSRKQPPPSQAKQEWLREYEMQLNEYARQLQRDTREDYERFQQMELWLLECHRRLRAALTEVERLQQKLGGENGRDTRPP